MLVKKLDREVRNAEREAKKICIYPTFRKVEGGGEVMFCISGKGISAPEDAKPKIGNVCNGEICRATTFYSGEYCGGRGRVDLRGMYSCHNKKSTAK
jgi:hypothetical protein